MRSLSNVIKSYNIKYTSEKKTIDMNQRAEEFQRLYIEGLPKLQEVENPTEQAPLSGYAADEAAERTELNEIENITSVNEEKKEQIKEELKEELDELRTAAEEECRRLKSNTEEECRQLIEDAKKKADKERAKLLIDTRREGYNEGKEIALNEVEELKVKLRQQISDNEADYENKVNQMEPAFVELVIQLVQKITGILVEDRRDLMLHVIRQSMLGIESSNNFIIRVSKADYDFINSKKQELLFELRGNTIEVVEDPILERAQCIIETDTRVLDCSLDVQLKNLIADLKLLSGISDINKES